MHRARSARSDTSDGDMDGLAAEKEMELSRCLRQLRIMENDRKAYSIESQDLIKRQKRELENLDLEKEEVLKDLRLIESRSNQNKDEYTIDNLSELGTTKLSIQDQIKEEKEKHEDLDAQIREARKNVREQHKNMGGANMSKSHAMQTQKKVTKLENTLQLSNKKFSNALERNKELRDEIESLRRGRIRFEGIYKKLEKELQQLRQEIGEVIDQSTQAYDARDEAQAKMILLKEKADKDLQQHNAEMKEHVRIIDHDKKLRDFMNTKCKERQEDPQLVAWRQRKEALEAERKKASQTDSVESYEAAFERIQEITGEDDMDLLVQRFVECEDRNFALFNYVNEQNNDMEMLSEQIQDIRDDIEKFKAQGVELEAQRRLILADLEENQEKASKEADEHNEKHVGVMKILDQLRAGVESLFNKINCDRAAIDDMLGSKEGINDKNMLQYLGIIEERTNQLLYIQAYMMSQKDIDDYSKRQTTLLGEGPQPAPQAPSILPPSVGDDYDSEVSEASEDEARPLTRNELESRVMKSVRKRETAAKKEGFRYDLSDAKEKAKKKDKGKGKH